MSASSIIRRYKDFEIVVDPDGSATIKQSGMEIKISSFTWMQFKASVREDRFDFPKK